MDFPCKHCDKADIEFVNDSEYGCDMPCETARSYMKTYSKQLDEMLTKLRELLKEK